jgi:hypothetical protein
VRIVGGVLGGLVLLVIGCGGQETPFAGGGGGQTGLGGAPSASTDTNPSNPHVTTTPPPSPNATPAPVTSGTAGAGGSSSTGAAGHPGTAGHAGTAGAGGHPTGAAGSAPGGSGGAAGAGGAGTPTVDAGMPPADAAPPIDAASDGGTNPIPASWPTVDCVGGPCGPPGVCVNLDFLFVACAHCGGEDEVCCPPYAAGDPFLGTCAPGLICASNPNFQDNPPTDLVRDVCQIPGSPPTPTGGLNHQRLMIAP